MEPVMYFEDILDFSTFSITDLKMNSNQSNFFFHRITGHFCYLVPCEEIDLWVDIFIFTQILLIILVITTHLLLLLTFEQLDKTEVLEILELAECTG